MKEWLNKRVLAEYRNENRRSVVVSGILVEVTDVDFKLSKCYDGNYVGQSYSRPDVVMSRLSSAFVQMSPDLDPSRD